MSIKKYAPLRAVECIESKSREAFTEDGYSDIVECSRYIDCLAELACRKAVEKSAIPNESEMSKAMRVCKIMNKQEDTVNSTAVLIYCADSWRRNKIVLCVHEDLIKALTATEYGEIKEPKRLALSKTTQYIDLETDGNPIDILGVKISGFFVTIGKEDKLNDAYKLINLCFVNADGTFRPVTFDIYRLKGKTVPEFAGELGACVDRKDRAFTVKSLIYALNIILYTCVANVDIRENEKQKKIYKKTTEIKNKYSEIRKFDLGFIYDSAKDKGNKREWVQECNKDAYTLKWGIKEQ